MMAQLRGVFSMFGLVCLAAACSSTTSSSADGGTKKRGASCTRSSECASPLVCDQTCTDPPEDAGVFNPPPTPQDAATITTRDGGAPARDGGGLPNDGGTITPRDAGGPPQTYNYKPCRMASDCASGQCVPGVTVGPDRNGMDQGATGSFCSPACMPVMGSLEGTCPAATVGRPWCLRLGATDTCMLLCDAQGMCPTGLTATNYEIDTAAMGMPPMWTPICVCAGTPAPPGMRAPYEQCDDQNRCTAQAGACGGTMPPAGTCFPACMTAAGCPAAPAGVTGTLDCQPVFMGTMDKFCIITCDPMRTGDCPTYAPCRTQMGAPRGICIR